MKWFTKLMSPEAVADTKVPNDAECEARVISDLTAKNERLFTSNVKLSAENASLKRELARWKPNRDAKGHFVKQETM